MSSKPALLVIVGPTGVGKTALSIHLAKIFGGEIVSADSRQLYRGMDIGTAKPGIEERAGIPHHLMDVAEPHEIWSVARFQQEAQKAINQINARGALPILVGGTGQYITAVLEAWIPPENPPDARLRGVLEAWGVRLGRHGLHGKLGLIDPIAARRIDPTNMRRTIRALEVIFSSGARFSDQIRKGENVYDSLTIGVTRPRQELYQRIDKRIDCMIQAGLRGEVQALLARGYNRQDGPLSAIGYREMARVIHGEITEDEAIVMMRRFTRRYIRQQYNWFSLSDPRIAWFEVHEGYEQDAARLVRTWLERKKNGG